MKQFKTKQHKYDNLPLTARRPLEYVGLGLFLFMAAGLLSFNHFYGPTNSTSASKPYTYNIQQSVDTRPKYKQNSFYTTSPEVSNTAFLADLTESIDAQFHYRFNASEVTELSYQYQATALIRALYGSDKSTEGGMSTVWSKQFVLAEPVTGKRQGTSVTFNPVISIPFADYRAKMEQFRNAYSAPINGELVVTYTMQLTSNVNGSLIKETKLANITVPLDQQVYKLSTKFEKESRKEVVPENAKSSGNILAKFVIPLAVILTIAGLTYCVYGLRKQKIKSPYQRELEKIYRYHDGIIIRAKHPPVLENKNIVTINKFDDMLNLEEELKTPIIASTVSDYTTHFFITSDDIAYVYTLGIPIPFKEKSV